MSAYDEFDDIPDEFSGVEGINWDELLSAPPPSSSVDTLHHNETVSPGARSPSTHYSCDDELDHAFLAELDALEQNIMQAEAGPSRDADAGSTRDCGESESARVDGSGSSPSSRLPQVLGSPSHPHSGTLISHSRFFSNAAENPWPPATSSDRPSKAIRNDDKGQIQLPSLKRRRDSLPLNSPSPNKKGKGKAQGNEAVWQVLSDFEDELTCPICSDIFVAAHLGNPCGHSFCGDCGWQWKMKGKRTCAICRAELSRETPMIPNFAMDNTVEKHIAALGQSGLAEWNPGGTLYEEWVSRKEQWKRNVADRIKAVPQKGQRLPGIQPVIFNLTLDIASDDEDEDYDYDAEEVQRRVVRPRRAAVRRPRR